MNEVKDALEEAEYFYQKMEATNIPKEFRFNVNAFISRARALTWVLKKQFSGNQRFSEWYASQEKLMRKDELMSFFKEARNISVKENPIRPRSLTSIRNIEVTTSKGRGFAITGDGEPVWIEKNGEGKEKQIHADEFDSEITRAYYFTNPIPPKLFQNLEVIDLCGLYLVALRNLVEEALKNFAEY
ncbi:MAG: hypothetical protein CW691_11075 [Candidatus Bathyarchaeum sp.]|nr:MAG: hypothetical protein CW691_11075 [Candidatus Bathyarchaeum sp.]